MKRFEERKQEYLSKSVAANPLSIITLSELIALPASVTSEQRLERLPAGTQVQSIFEKEIIRLQNDGLLSTRLIRNAAEIPKLDHAYFKYSHELEECRDRIQSGENLLISTVMDEGHTIAFAIALLGENESAKVEIIDVNEFSRRSSGLHIVLELEGEQFGVGAGHVVAQVLIHSVRGTITVDATNPSSRYLFKSLGFVKVSDQSNPCLLHRPSLVANS